MTQYYNAVQEYATYLSRYKLFKLMNDFNVERKIGLERLDDIDVHVNAAKPEESCHTFVQEINKIVAYADRSFQLIVAQSGLFIPFDITSSPIEDKDIRHKIITSKFKEYFERSLTLLPRDSEERDGLSRTVTKKLPAILAAMKRILILRDAEKHLNYELTPFFEEIRKVNLQNLRSN